MIYRPEPAARRIRRESPPPLEPVTSWTDDEGRLWELKRAEDGALWLCGDKDGRPWQWRCGEPWAALAERASKIF